MSSVLKFALLLYLFHTICNPDAQNLKGTRHREVFCQEALPTECYARKITCVDEAPHLWYAHTQPSSDLMHHPVSDDTTAATEWCGPQWLRHSQDPSLQSGVYMYVHREIVPRAANLPPLDIVSRPLVWLMSSKAIIHRHKDPREGAGCYDSPRGDKETSLERPRSNECTNGV